MSQFTRRKALAAGVGAVIGGPSLLSMMSKAALAQDAGVKRLILFYFPEGAAQQAFWPATGPGALNINMNASVGNGNTPESRNTSIANYRSQAMGTYCLQPLKPHERDISIVSGFRVQADTGASDPHMQVIRSCLTGGRQNEGSFDQIMGPRLQGDAPISSIFSSLYGEHVNINVGSHYASPFRAVGGGSAQTSWNPVTTYNQVFPNGVDPVPGGGPDHTLTSRLAVMTSVRSRLNAVRCAGGADAQSRMESYLASVERIEAETQALVDQGNEMPAVDLPLDVPANWVDIRNNNKYWHNPNNFGPLMKIQLDTTVAALALNRTRVSFMQFSATGSSRGIDGSHYRTVGIPNLESSDVNDHNMGHNPAGDRRRNQARIFRWYYGQMAYLIDQLKSVPDGQGQTLFDSTLIVGCSEWSMYNHRTVDMPYLIAGNPGGAFRMGQYLDARQNGQHRNAADFFLTLARGLGVNLDRFGSSSGVYNPLLT